MNKVKVGRPPNKYDARLKSFKLPIHICSKLETYNNQTNEVIKALERHFEIDGKSKEWAYNRKEELEKELKSISELISAENEKEKEEKERIEKLKSLQKENYKKLCKRLDCDISNGTATPIKAFSELYNLDITEDKYEEMIELRRMNSFSFDFYKSLSRCSDG